MANAAPLIATQTAAAAVIRRRSPVETKPAAT
jgi:hypothetical protein